MFDYTGRVVAITGASSGLGQQMARGFAAQSATVVLLARRKERLTALAEEIREAGGQALAIALDVTNDEQIEASLKEILDTYGKVDVLVNCAGGNKPGSAVDVTDEAWDFTIELDLTSIMKMTRAYAKPMVKAGYGRIINIASMYGLMGTDQQALPYHASKAGVIGFTKAASAELAKQGVTVNAIAPGFFETELTIDTLSTESFQAYMDVTVPAKRFGRAGELNSTAIWLGAEESSYVTGITVPVDGGWSTAK